MSWLQPEVTQVNSGIANSVLFLLGASFSYSTL